jgi:endonuclease III
LAPDLGHDGWVDAVVEELVDKNEIPLDSCPVGDDLVQIHEVSVQVASTAMSVAPPEFSTEQKRNARVILARLKKIYPEMGTALDYADAWQLLVATVLSAQTTDENVNRVTPVLFERWPTADELAEADPEDVEHVVFSTGFYRQKTKSIQALSSDLVEEYGGAVPQDLDEMTKLRGVGRKTASVVLAEAWNIPAIAVDTHVKRVTNRVGLTTHTDPVKVEMDLAALYPESEWSGISMRVIQFGRDTCIARKPRCWECPLVDRCTYPDKTPAPEQG